MFLSLLTLVACTDDVKDTADTALSTDTDTTIDTAGDTGTPVDLEGYDFPSAFTDGSSVSYSGQIFRQLLIDDMKSHLGGMTDRLNAGTFFPVAGEVETELDFYFEFDSDAYGQVPLLKTGSADVLQSVYDDVSSGKNLVEKIAGNDATGQHEDWTTGMVGWDAVGITTPESLVRAWFAQIDDQAVDWAAGATPLGPDGSPVPAVYVTPEGQDLQQLLEKVLRGALAYSQATDDYLDDDLADKGLNSSHEDPGDAAYSDLEHAWDEGFGYFGAARTYGSWTDAEISDKDMDVDGDAAIDLLTEVCWGHSVNAGKRDAGAEVATDMTADAWDGFLAGRTLLADTAGSPLSGDQLAELQGYRDQAVLAWEQAIASTIVHYVNDTLQDMGAIGTDDYSFADHAKHWSELKGFALGLQFNRMSPMTADFAELHSHLGQAPVLPSAGGADVEDYADALIAARTLIVPTSTFVLATFQ